MLTHACTGDSWTLICKFDSSFVGILLLSPGSWYAQGFVCVSQESVSLVLWKFCNQVPLACKVKFPGGSCLLGGCMVGLMANSSKRAYVACCVTQVCCSQSHCPRCRPLLPLPPRETLQGRPGSVSVGLWVVVYTRFCLSSLSVSGCYGV